MTPYGDSDFSLYGASNDILIVRKVIAGERRVRIIIVRRRTIEIVVHNDFFRRVVIVDCHVLGRTGFEPAAAETGARKSAGEAAAAETTTMVSKQVLNALKQELATRNSRCGGRRLAQKARETSTRRRRASTASFEAA